MGVIRRGQKLYVRMKGPAGKWATYATGFVIGEETKAEKVLNSLRNSIAAGVELFGKRAAPVTVRDYCLVKFFPKRQGLLENWKTDQRRMELHVLPVLGAMPLRDVRARHLIALVERMRTAGEHAPKTVYNVYGVIKALFRDAIIDELLDASPCVLDETHLGANEDADPEWRDTAVFTRPELERLLSDRRVSVDRQVLYALKGIGALRDGEANGLRWKHYDPTPLDLASGALGRLTVAKSNQKGTKTGRSRAMPVHPVLAAMLAEWRMSGWPSMMGRNPEPEDLVIPMPAPTPGKGRRAPLGSMRTDSINLKALTKDLEALGLRHRSGHDLRRTMITLAQEDGAIQGILEQCTHTPKRAKAIGGYTIYSWPVRSAEVGKLKISRRTNLGAVLPMRQAVGVKSSHVEGEATMKLVTASSQLSATMRKRSAINVEAAGIEPDARNSAQADLPHSGALGVEIPDASRTVGIGAEANDGAAAQTACDGVTEAVNRARSEWLSSGSRRGLRRALLEILSMLETEGGDA